MSDNIPFKIQAEIVNFFPVKSLIRLRSVSKQWHSLITSFEFISDYHNHHPQPPENIFVSYYDKYSCDQKFVSFLDDDDTLPINKFSFKVPPFINKQDAYRLLIRGSSNGLLCLYDVGYRDKKIATLWNPTLCKSVVIDLDIELDSRYSTVVGLGVCPHTLDPKLVKVKYLDCDYEYENVLGFIPPCQVEVYTLSTGVWRIPLCHNVPREFLQFTHSVVDINGFLYFICFEWIYIERSSKKSYQIFSFDMKSEEFTEIRLPYTLAIENLSVSLHLSKLRESLVVLEYVNEYSPDVFCNVWMIENDVQRSVTKLFTISPEFGNVIRVFGFMKNGLPLISVKFDSAEDDGLVVYEPKSKQMSSIGISGRCDSFLYVETLLLLNH